MNALVDPSLLLPLLLLGLVFYMFSRQRKTQAEQQRQRAGLTPGDRVMTTAGMFGTVVGVEGDKMHLEVAPGVQVTMLTAALSRVLPPEEPAFADGDLPFDVHSAMDSDGPHGSADGHVSLTKDGGADDDSAPGWGDGPGSSGRIDPDRGKNDDPGKHGN
ncbi:MAG: preprotein translocase subunit YajC [Actinomycetales bacterium]